jgi:prevent-host-death family protein
MGQTIVGVYEAKTHLSKLVRRAAAGEEVIIASAGRPVAKLVPYSAPSEPRRPGMLKGRVEVGPGFDDLPPGFEEVV